MRERDAILTILALAVVATGAVVLLVPKGDLGEEAQLATLAPSEALARLDAMQSPLSPQLAFRQAELAAALGDAVRADGLLAALADRTGDGGTIAMARADLALRTGDLLAAAGHLAGAQATAPNPELRQRLGLLYRRLQDPAAERAMLAAVGIAGLTGAERLRLVDLTAADGAAEEALALAGSGILPGDAAAAALAERFAALALATGATDRLAEAAVGWLVGADARVLGRALAAVLAHAPQSAAPMAASIVTRAPTARAPLVAALSEAGLFGVARSLAQPWVASGLAEVQGWSALITYSDLSGDTGLLEIMLQRRTLRDLPPPEAFLPLVRYGGGQALLPYRALLTAELLAKVPLVDAAWALWRQRPDIAFAALQRAVGPASDPALWREVAGGLRESGYLERLRAMAATDAALAAMFDG